MERTTVGPQCICCSALCFMNEIPYELQNVEYYAACQGRTLSEVNTDVYFQGLVSTYNV